jgi:transcriptional regulator
MAKRQAEIMKGTLDLLVLKTLELEPRHGVGVADRIRQITNGTFVVRPGSLFPALHRLEEAGWLSSLWEPSENNRRAKYYSLTSGGRAKLKTEQRDWGRQVAAIARILEA